MASPPWKDDWKPAGFEEESIYSRRLCQDFLHGWERAAFASTRNGQHFDNTLTFRFADHFLESAVAVLMLTENGMLRPLRRELRFLVEHSVKVTAVDQRMGRASLEERLAYLKISIPRSSVDVGGISFWGLTPASAAEIQRDGKTLFSFLSRYVHPSQDQLTERLRAGRAGNWRGFESTAQLQSVNKLVSRVYDFVLVHLFECLGPSNTGDVFIEVLDDEPGWKFHRGKFMHEVGAVFDYKIERQERRALQVAAQEPRTMS